MFDFNEMSIWKEHIPDHIEYIAIYEDGEVFGFTSEPVINEDYLRWEPTDGYLLAFDDLEIPFTYPAWRESLIKRPE